MVENVIQIKKGAMINIDLSLKNIIYYIWNPGTCSCKNCKYLANINDHSVITHDLIIDTNAMWYDEETKSIPKNFMKKK